MKSEELQEKAKLAEQLEELQRLANEAESIVNHLLEEMRELDFQEPHGWLSEIVYNLRSDIENRLERL